MNANFSGLGVPLLACPAVQLLSDVQRASRLTRRSAICALGAGLAAGSLASDSLSAEAPEISPATAKPDAEHPYVDAHVHVWTPDTVKYPLAKRFSKADMKPPSFTPEQLLAHARPNGVGRIVLVQMLFYGYDNSYMLDTMQRYPGVFSGIGVVNEHEKPREAMKKLAERGVRGFRLFGPGQPAEPFLTSPGMMKMWRCGAEENLSMCLLVNPEALEIVDRLCEKHPQTPVVVDHFGRIGMDGPIQQKDVDNLCRLARHKRAHVKVSAFYALGKKKPPYDDLVPMIRRLVDAFGAQRLMWASDCPFQVDDATYRDSIGLIHKQDFLSDGDKQWLLRKTAERVFFS